MPSKLVLKNPNASTTLKIHKQDPVLDKDGKKLPGKWKDVPSDAFIAPGQFVEIWLGDTRRVIIEEIPA